MSSISNYLNSILLVHSWKVDTLQSIYAQEQQSPQQPQQLQPLPISASNHKDVGTVTSEIKYDNSRTDQSNRDKKGQVLNAAVKAKINSEWLKTKEKKQAAIRDGVKSKVNKSADNKPNK